MGIAELAARLLADPSKDEQQPPMGEGDVRSQLYGRSVATNNVLRTRGEGSDKPADPADLKSEVRRREIAWSGE